MKERVTTYLQLLALPIQLDNMGFEEMINYYCPPPKPWFEPLLQRLFNVMILGIKGLFSKSQPLPTRPRKNIPDDIGGLHTYDYEHKMFNRGYETSRVENEETLNPEVRLINRGVSMMDLTTGYERGNHLDKLVTDEPISVDTSPVIEPEPYNLDNEAPRNKKGPSAVPDSLPQSEVSVIGRKAVLDNSGLSLEPFLLPPFITPQGKRTPQLGEQQHHPIAKLESPQFEDRNHGIDSESISDTKNQNQNTSSNILKKRGKAKNLDLQLDGDQGGKNTIPDNLSPISKYVESNQITPINKNQAPIAKSSTKLASQEVNTQSQLDPEPFNLDDSFDTHKKKTGKRKKKIRPDLKLSDLKPEEDDNKDYIGWKPYTGQQS